MIESTQEIFNRARPPDQDVFFPRRVLQREAEG